LIFVTSAHCSVPTPRPTAPRSTLLYSALFSEIRSPLCFAPPEFRPSPLRSHPVIVTNSSVQYVLLSVLGLWHAVAWFKLGLCVALFCSLLTELVLLYYSVLSRIALLDLCKMYLYVYVHQAYEYDTFMLVICKIHLCIA